MTKDGNAKKQRSEVNAKDLCGRVGVGTVAHLQPSGVEVGVRGRQDMALPNYLLMVMCNLLPY